MKITQQGTQLSRVPCFLVATAEPDSTPRHIVDPPYYSMRPTPNLRHSAR
ncbi:MAG: hypothetical protein K2G01_02110 [Paramuribaculum sp.]|nr:hypothetical protein [Paramuribaculum sp.]